MATNTMTHDHLLFKAIQSLAAVCDGAKADDMQGFSGVHTHRGKRLALMPADKWTGRDQRWAYDTCHIYRKQLSRYGIDYDQIPVPAASDSEGLIDSNNGVFEISFPYDPQLVDAIKRTVPGRRFDPNRKLWTAPITAEVVGALEKLQDHFTFTEAATLAAEAAESAPIDKQEPKPDRFVDFDEKTNLFKVFFGFDRDLVAAIRSIPGARFIGEYPKHWTCPLELSSVSKLRGVNPAFQFSALAEKAAIEIETRQNANRVLSAAASADMLDSSELLAELLRDPYPFQKAGTLYALTNKNPIIGDEPGLGKTIQALTVIHVANAYQSLIICPPGITENWRAEIMATLPIGYDQVCLPLPNTSLEELQSALIIVVGLAALADGAEKVENKNTRKKELKVILSPLAQKLCQLKFKNITVDEAHSIKNEKAQCSMAVAEIKNASQPEYFIQLTGTAFLNRPADIINNLRLSGALDNVFGGFIKFTVRYCDGHKGKYGWDYKGCTNPEELNDRLRANGCYIQRKKTEVLPELPEKTRTFGSLPLNSSWRARYDAAAQDIYSEIKADAFAKTAADENFQRSLEGLTGEQKHEAIRQHCIDLCETAMQGETLVRLQKLETIASEGKTEAAIQWIENFLESGEKLIVMASQAKLIKALQKAFPQALAITAETAAADRVKTARLFNESAEHQLIICAMGKHAGACPIIGLNMQSASNVLMLSIGWQPGHHDQCEDRALRIGSKNAVNIYYLPAAGTFEVDKLAVVERKRQVTTRCAEGTAKTGKADEGSQLFFLRKIFETVEVA